MSDFTERARAVADREYPLSESPVMDRADVLATYRQAAFMWGAEWARRELLADPTEAEMLPAAAALMDGDPLAEDVYGVDDYLAMARAAVCKFLEARRGSA